MKRLKKLLSFLMTLILLVECCLPEALADGGTVSESFLREAEQLAGQADDAPRWHDGMLPEASWNAVQLKSWLDHVLSNEHYSVAFAHTMLERSLQEIEESDKEAYDRLTGGQYSAYTSYMSGVANSVENMREILRSYRNDCELFSNTIVRLVSQIRAKGIGSREKIRYSRQLENAVQEISNIRKTVVESYASWIKQIEEWQKVFSGTESPIPPANNGIGTSNDASSMGFSEWLQEIEGWGKKPVQTEVSTDVLGSRKNDSLLAKLSPIGSALADNTMRQVITVLNNTQFAVVLKTPSGQTTEPVTSGKVTIWNASDGDLPTAGSAKTSDITDKGFALFNVSDFKVNSDGIMEVNMLINSNGFQALQENKISIKRGGTYEMILVRPVSGSAPYFLSAQFNGTPMLASQRKILYSPANDASHEIKVIVMFPNGYNGSSNVTMKYYDASDSNKEKTVTVSPDSNSNYTANVDGYTAKVYTFSGKWKQLFAPGKSVSFQIGNGVYVESMLTVERGVVDVPVIGTDNAIYVALMNAIGNFGNFLSFDFKVSSAPKALQNQNVSLNLPFLDVLPKFSLGQDGSLIIAWGLNITEEEPDRWKTKDQKEYDQKLKNAEAETRMQKYLAQIGAANFTHNETKKTFFFVNINASLFAMLTGRLLRDSDSDKGDQQGTFKAANMSATFGAVVTVTGDFTFRPAPPLSAFYINIEASLSFTFAVTVPLIWRGISVNFKNLKELGTKPEMGNLQLTLLVRLQLTFTAGLGIKGAVGLYISGMAGFNLLIQYIDNVQLRTKVTFDAGVRAGIDLFFVKYYIDLLKGSWTLVDNLTNMSAFNLMDLILPRANAEDSTETGDSASLEPESYPVLVPEVTQVMVGEPMKDVKVKFVDYKNETYAFYIGEANGYQRVSWKPLTKHTEEGPAFVAGSLDKALETACDVYNTIKHTPSVSASYALQYYSDLSVIREMHDYSFDVFTDENGICIIALCASEFENITYDVDGKTETVKVPKDSTSYVFWLKPNANKELDCMKKGIRVYEWGEDINIPRAFCDKVEIDYPCDEIHFTSCSMPSELVEKNSFRVNYWIKAHQDLDKKEDMSRLDTINIDIGCNKVRRTVKQNQDPDSKIDTLKPNAKRYQRKGTYIASKLLSEQKEYSSPLPGMSISAGGMMGIRWDLFTDQEKDDFDSTYRWYDIERADGDSENASLVYGEKTSDGSYRQYAMSTDDENVIFYTTMPFTTRVFYIDQNRIAVFQDDSGDGDEQDDSDETEKETEQMDVENWLKSYVGTPGSYIATDYDVKISASSFNIQKISDVTYLYWLSTAQQKNKTDSDVYRLKAVVYDQDNDTISNEFVLAEFSMPNSQTLSSVYLSENGYGYCTTTVTKENALSVNVYEFPIQWIPNMELSGGIINLKDNLISPATWLDATITLLNDGNCGISSFNVEQVVVTSNKDGTESESVAETIHIDLLDPDNSFIKARYNGGDYWVARGRRVYCKQEQAIEMQQSDHYVQRRSSEEQQNEYFSSKMILPGTLRAYTIPIYIPGNWSGEKTVYLRLGSITTRANWVVANNSANTAANSALANNALGNANSIDPNPEITYVRAVNGKMVRMPGNPLVKVNPLTEFYAEFAGNSDSLEINHQLNDLDVSYHVYRNISGEPYISITVMNFADIDEPLDLYACMYPDNSGKPVDLNLPYYSDKTTNGFGQTIDMPLAALMGDSHPRTVRVVIRARNVDETILQNNEFILHFNDDEVGDPLRFVQQPAEQLVQLGETATFMVEVAGGVKPYTYRWQQWKEETGWTDIANSNSPELTLEKVTLDMQGKKVRCVVTDYYMNQITSNEAALSVISTLPKTGDNNHLLLYISLVLLGFVMLLWIRRRESDRG